MRYPRMLWLPLSLFFWSLGFSGEFGGQAGAAPETEAGTAAMAADGGTEAVYAAQAGSSAIYEENQTAEEQLRQYAEAKGFAEGWDEARKRFFVLQSSAFNVKEPQADRNFLIKREMAAKQAALQAKSDLIRFINSEMSARDQIDVPGTDIYAALNLEYDAARERLLAQQGVLAKLLEQVDAAEARALAGITFGDRVNAFMDAAIKRLDREFDAGNIEAAHQARYEAAKQRYAEAAAELDSLQREAEALRGQVTNTFSSSLSVQARMPLVGASVIQQAESWSNEDGQYQVAVLFCWSAELEKSARAALSGDLAGADGKIGGQSLSEWLAEQNFSAMVGPRQFLDDRGQRHFLGIASRPAVRDADADRNNRTIADLFAGQMALFSLFADVDSFAEARQLVQSRSSGNLENASDTAVAETLALRISQKFESMRIQGLTPLLRKKIKHALTGQEMHVSVYGISPAAAATAMRLERQAALSAIAFHRDQAFKAARSQAINAAIAKSRTDPAARRAGELAGRAEIDEAWRQAADNAVSPAPTGKTASGSIMAGEPRDNF